MTGKVRHIPAIGIPLTIVASLFNASMATTVKLINNVPSQFVVCMRFLVSLVLISTFIPFLCRKQSLKKVLKPRKLNTYFLRIITALISLYSYFYALQHIELSSAVVLVFTSPLFIPIVTWFIQRTPIPHIIWWALGIGFVGVLCIMGPRFTSLGLGYLAALIAGISAAISFVAGRLQTKTETPFRINFYLFLVGTLLSLLLTSHLLINHFNTISTRDWVLMILIGCFGLIYQYLMITAIRYTQVRFVGSFLYFTILFAFLGEWIFFKAKPTPLNFIGILLIVFGGFLMTILDPMRRKNRP